LLERKYGDRSNWKRVIKREYTQSFLDTEEFKGYITLLKVHRVSEPLFVQYGEKRVCIVDDGYIWLQHFPSEKRYSLTTMFDSNGEIVQWYIVICLRNGFENNIPWLDDLFLDIVVLPTGEVIQLDGDELEEALKTGIINKTLYKTACYEADKINSLIKSSEFELMNLSKVHKELLLEG
jgi:predicted RNA-binding protein associated with RNAse of E/G family